jgi:hypothetical protein
MLEPIYRLVALFARGAKADISARGTKRVEALVVPWHQFTYSLLVPRRPPGYSTSPRGTRRAQILWYSYCKCSVTISYTTVRDTSGHSLYTSLIVKCRFSAQVVCANVLYFPNNLRSFPCKQYTVLMSKRPTNYWVKDPSPSNILTVNAVRHNIQLPSVSAFHEIGHHLSMFISDSLITAFWNAKTCSSILSTNTLVWRVPSRCV